MNTLFKLEKTIAETCNTKVKTLKSFTITNLRKIVIR